MHKYKGVFSRIDQKDANFPNSVVTEPIANYDWNAVTTNSYCNKKLKKSLEDMIAPKENKRDKVIRNY